MADVAAASGVSRATLYRYYSSREELLEALVETAAAEAAERLAEAGFDRVPAEEGIARAARAIVAAAVRYEILIREYVVPDTQPLADKMAAPLLSLFERARQEGVIRDDIPLPWLTESMMALIAAGVRTRQQLGMGLEDVASSVTQLLLDGAKRRSAPGDPSD